MFRSLVKPVERLFVVWRYTVAAQVHQAHIVLSDGVAALRSQAEPFQGLGKIRRSAFSVVIQRSQVHQGLEEPTLGRLFEQLAGTLFILGHAVAQVIKVGEVVLGFGTTSVSR